MPSLVGPALPAGTLRALQQPRLSLGPDVLLRQWDVLDAASVRTAFAEPDIQFWHGRRMDTLQEAEAWTASWAARWEAETDVGWAIATQDTDESVGQVALRTLSLAEAQAQITYWLLPIARGHSVAARAAAAVASWAMDTLNLERVYLKHSTANRVSCRVATAAGFGVEGTMRREQLHADGWHDMHLHSLVAHRRMA
jgi:ribosomal-protein-alanine N-acetyltransferase